MLKSQTLAIELSETRQRVNELLDKDDLATEERAELDTKTARLRDIEPEIQAALTAEGITEFRTDDPADRELRQLARRANLGEIFDAVLEHRATTGAEAEIQTHYGLNINQIPLAMLEVRAVTPAPGDVGQNQSTIVPGVFPDSCAAFLGVDMPTVGTGEAVFPVLTTNATVHTPAENASAAETTGAFSADVLSPARLQASFFYSREDRARFAGMDESLRQNLNDALSDGLDKQIISGTNGLLTGTNLANNNVATVTNFALYLSQFGYGRVDGTYASMTADLRAVVGAGTYANMGAQYRNDSVDRNALDRLMEITGGIKVSAHVPAVASNKQNAVIRRGMRRDMVAPVWTGVTLIPDEITLAANGQIKVTAVMLHAVKVLRTAGFYKQQTQHA